VAAVAVTSLRALLDEAAQSVARLTPHETSASLAAGAMLVDIRSDGARARDGVVPGSLHIPRSVLEWRLEPDGRWRTPYVDTRRERVVLICDHGYSSLLAAATLVRCGVHAADVIGGFEAWRTARLPTRPVPDRPLAAGELPGMRPPE
jgi:rhodanese-related sulfurtransferase